MTAPFEVVFDTRNVSDGDHVAVAIAHDAAGNVARSGVVAMRVNNGGGYGGSTSAGCASAGGIPLVALAAAVLLAVARRRRALAGRLTSGLALVDRRVRPGA